MKKTNSVPKYNFKTIERRWQKRWERDRIFHPDMARAKNPFYNLMMFPYPSAEGLHVGNMYAFTGADTFGRYKKLCGYDVFEPIGLDGFGIHSENYAMKIGKHIKNVSERSEKNFYKQLQRIGNMYDWSRTVETYKPNYYKWTQWLFLQMFRNGLAYQKKAEVNWCPSCKTVLSDEQVIQGQCERCDSFVEKRELKQWFFRITKYADKLLKNLEWIDWTEDIKTNQRNWIGRSEGATINFPVVISVRDTETEKFPESLDEIIPHKSEFNPRYSAISIEIEVFTTRPDTLFGCTYMVLSPEHYLIEKVKDKIENWRQVQRYIKKAIGRSEQDRKNDERNKTGIELKGIKAINPATKKPIPIWAADYVLAGYGMGAIMAVPAHDQRDWEFAKKYHLPIRQVIVSKGDECKNPMPTGRQEKSKIKMTDQNAKNNKISNIIILHGRQRFEKKDGPPQNVHHWLGWLKNELEKKKIKAINPLIKKDWEASYEDWKKEFEKNINIINEHTILVGISAGGAFLVRWLSETKKRIKKLILVAPAKFLGDMDDRNDKIKSFYDFNIDPEIKNRTKEIIIFTSNDKKRHIKAAKIYQKELGAKTIKLENRGHFTIKDSPVNKKFPELLDEILKQESSEAFTGEGVNVNSNFLNGLRTKEAKKEITKWLVKNKLGKKAVDYKLRDWCISRQRYWGPPIPIVWCKNCALNKMPKNEKPKVLIIHGFEGSSSRNWFPWIKKEFEKMGCEVFAPDISDSFHPNIETWMEDLKPFMRKLNKNSIIIGHSLGSKAAMHLLERTDKKVAKVFFVASAIGNPKRNWKAMEKMFAGSDIKSLKKFWEYKVNWDKVNDSLNETHFIISSNDKIIDPKHYKIAKLDNVHIEIWKEQGHFVQSKNEMLRDYIFEKTFANFEAVPVPEKDLPVKLPPMKDFLPEGKGKGPLAKNEKFVNVKCPVCGKPAKRETDVSDPFVDSSWYFFRYPSTEFDDKPFDKKRTKKWLPVDSYIGGREHTVLHLLYSRFITMALKDLGYIDFEEPYKRFFGHGLITKDGAKMSKSKGNVVNPDDMIDKYGADTLRLYLRFLGDFGQGGDWRDSGIEGMNKFVRRMWTVFFEITGEGNGVKNMSMIDKTIKIIGEDIDSLSFNTAVARLMEYVNWLRKNSSSFDAAQAKKAKETLSLAIAPMAPHVAEEMWETLGNKTLIFTHRWPKYDENNIIDEEIELVIQINGKVRDRLKVSRDISEEEAKNAALESEKAQKYISGQKVKKIIYVPRKLVSVVV